MKLHLHQSEDGTWYWHLDNKTGYESWFSEHTYSRKSDAIRGALRFAAQVAESAIALDDSFEYYREANRA